MVFSSSAFLFAFLPLFLAAYFIVPIRWLKNTWLLLASLVFYTWGEPVYVLLMTASILVNWAFGLALGRMKDSAARTATFVAAVVFNILVIGFFKYEGFVADSINGLVGTVLVPNLELPLPIGISFYTLQALSYVIDVYRRDVEAQANLLYLGMYIASFPQLIAGPIVRYNTIQRQIVGRRENLDDFASGLRLFIVGLAKKVLLANTVAILAQKMLEMGGSDIGFIGAWAGLVAFTFQIYFDFSGYSDMAIGLGRMMGFKYLRNFNYPYIARSISEFWRRWNMSLTAFFRDYLYIPLGGSRCSNRRWAFNIIVVWAIIGLWHGATWSFVWWGAYYGVLIICEKLLWGRALARAPRIIQHIYTLAIVVFAHTFFWITDTAQLIEYWQALAGFFGMLGTSTMWQLTAWVYWPLFIICAIASTPVAAWAKHRFLAWVEGREAGPFMSEGIANVRHMESDELCTLDVPDGVQLLHPRALAALRIAYDLVLLALLLASCASIVSGSYNPFIYFQF